ncbi:MAG: PAS domain S-box protein, partial [Burkholderiales bacterium]
MIFAPVLTLVALTAFLAVAAWSFGWYAREMQIAAEITGGVAVTLATWLLYRQVGQEQAATRALQNVTARVSDIVESAMDPIITIDTTQRIVLFNAAAEKIFGGPRGAVIGQPVDKLLPERFRDEYREHIERFGRTGTTAQGAGGTTVLTGLRASGEEFPMEASISQHNEEGRPL